MRPTPDQTKEQQNRFRKSLEGLSVVEKITDFLHAVCRVSNGRGSAILVGLPRHHRQQLVFLNNGHTKSRHVGGPEGRDEQREAECSGVLLTTSFVFPNRDEAQGSSVTFLEQPVVGTSARHGRPIWSVQAPVCADKVFYQHVNANLPKKHNPQPPPPPPRGMYGTHDAESRNNGPYTFADSNISSTFGYEEDGVLGFTFTVCNMKSLHCPRQSAFFSRRSSLAGKPQRPPPSGDPFDSFTDFQSSNNSTFQAKSSERVYSPHSSISEMSVCGSFGGNANWRSLKGISSRSPIRPLPLPLLLSNLPPVRVGDTHLIVAHINGKERRSVVVVVKSVESEYCEYDFFDLEWEYSSGGPIFDMQGNFIGIQHQVGFSAYGIFTTAIVRDLFKSMRLGICRIPIGDTSNDMAERSVHSGTGEDALSQLFRVEGGHSNLNVGAGDQIIPFEDFQRLHLRDTIKKTKLSSAGDPPTSDAVWEEFHTDFNSIVLMLHAFAHAPQITKTALREMASNEYTKYLPNAASMGGIGILLEIIDEYANDVEIVLAAVIVLARVSLYKLNRETIYRCDGILTLLHIMDEYSYYPSIQHWGFCCLRNVMDVDSVVRAEAVELFAQCDGIDLATEVIRLHKDERHVMRQASLALSCVAREHAKHAEAMVVCGIGSTLAEDMRNKAEDSFTFFGLVSLLYELLHCIASSSGVVPSSDDPSRLLRTGKHDWDNENSLDLGVVTPRSFLVSESGKLLLQELNEGHVLQLLSDVMESTSHETLCGDLLRLMTECAGSVFILLILTGCCEEPIVKRLYGACDRLVVKNPSEAALVRRSKNIMCWVAACAPLCCSKEEICLV
ncbi:hypothetical protein DPX39_070024300 [Trypanosoma brucei equiperdum]|uniref:Uncharacterized protein n=1 Tax=Trypanosoma brucei equiperdum TaxID=630700 RepID=A0A3L6L4Z9_9TRYP|nr:hypothetical protein DPX39_070024300 [Trypanosoma brucei equiperdum]